MILQQISSLLFSLELLASYSCTMQVRLWRIGDSKEEESGYRSSINRFFHLSRFRVGTVLSLVLSINSTLEPVIYLSASPSSIRWNQLVINQEKSIRPDCHVIVLTIIVPVFNRYSSIWLPHLLAYTCFNPITRHC